jgi:rod shape-determining protein MreC
MKELLRHKGKIIIAVTLLLLTLIGFTMREDDKQSSLSEVLSVPLLPLRKVFMSVSLELENKISYFKDLKILTEENETLRNSLTQAIIEKTEVESLRKENIDLRKALNFAERHQDYSLLPAYVVSREIDNWNDLYVIDVGRKQGIELDKKEEFPGSYAVVNGEGLIGRILRTTYNSSKVLSIIDHGSTVSGVLTRSRYNVEVKGLFELSEQGLCYVGNIDYDSDIAVGDYVETSGIGNNYPRSILIGTITSVVRDESSKTIHALLKPAVDFKRINMVYVLKSKEL